ncbi:hypothetical protein DIPPA_05552 [Diplonema papillatum]|nr:hypothetical protein DIPPA_05552 [Diplonema papillatum]
MAEKYPALVDRIRLLLSKFSAKSHARRRETELKAGCTPTELHRLLVAEGFALSESCLRRMFKAPHAGRKAASKYLNRFDVRLEGHEDTGREHHVDDHFCRSQVRLVVEAAMFANASNEHTEAMVLSVDAKCIVPLGVVAVNKNINTKTYYRVEEPGQPRKPQVDDHSFVSGAGVKPVCILELVPEAAELSLSKNHAKDANNRLHYPYPRNGPVRIFLRSTKYSRTNSQTNTNDTRLLEKAFIPPVVCIISDNACDYGPSSLATGFSLWRLFRDFRLDALVCVTYAAGHSAYNPVERAMSHLTSRLSGCSFGSAPKSTQREDREMHERATKEMSDRFNFASGSLTFVCSAIPPTGPAAPVPPQQKVGRKSKGSTTNPPSAFAAVVASVMMTLAPVVEHRGLLPGSRIAVAACLAVAAAAAAPVYDCRRKVYTDYDDIRFFLSSSKKIVEDDQTALMEEYRLMNGHMDRGKNLVVFRRCEGRKAATCAHCKRIPALRAPYFLERSMQEKTSGFFYTPIPEDEPDRAHTLLHPPSQQQPQAMPSTQSDVENDAESLAPTQASAKSEDEDDDNDAKEEDTHVPRTGEGHYLCFHQLRRRTHIEIPTDFFRPSLRGKEHKWRCPTASCGKLCLSEADVRRHYRLLHTNLAPTKTTTNGKRKGLLWHAHVNVAKTQPDSDKGREARLRLWNKTVLREVARKASVELPANFVATDKGLIVSTLLAAWDRISGLVQELEAQPRAKFRVPKNDLDTQSQGQTQDDIPSQSQTQDQTHGQDDIPSQSQTQDHKDDIPSS